MENLWHIISKPDNIPIVGLMVLLVFLRGWHSVRHLNMTDDMKKRKNSYYLYY